MNNVILLNKAAAALTNEKNLDLVKPTYGFVNTQSIVERFERQGWMLSDAKQVKAKNVDRQGYQRHMLKFRNENFLRIPGLPEYHESIPELIVENSHDGTSALKIFFGVFRIACLNGLISGSNIHSMRVTHSQNTIKNLDQSIDGMTAGIPDLIEKVSHYSNIELTDEKRVEFAREAAALRLDYNSGLIHDTNLYAMLSPRRHSDVKNDAFSVFNVIQEKVIRGGIIYKKMNEENGFLEKKTTRAVNSVNQSIKLNRGLWNILENVAS